VAVLQGVPLPPLGGAALGPLRVSTRAAAVEHLDLGDLEAVAGALVGGEAQSVLLVGGGVAERVGIGLEASGAAERGTGWCGCRG
jgi:hypothetical protein